LTALLFTRAVCDTLRVVPDSLAMIELNKWQIGYLICLASVLFVLWFFQMRQKRPDGREDIRGWLRALAGMIGIFAGIFIVLKVTTNSRATIRGTHEAAP
jgi:hypothetical protein